MSMERLSQQVDAYVAWKRELMREITRYRSWLEHNRLNSEAVQAKLERALKILRTDHITLAFVGEFSRGKTELINSLFFSEYGQRMLPSHAGRTTMCPTELFFDPRSERPYIRLLPIETRTASASVAQFKRIPRHWVNIPLDTSDPANMALAFSQVAKTKSMPVEQAIQLGFHPDMLEGTGKRGQVLVPAWRHAMVNFDHPLLRQGLRILDTPGLNALGSEPELTLSMLPNAQAIIFLLAADTGVTASDMSIWQQHIRQLDEDAQTSLFAVLNKIDVLWDDLAGETFVQNAIGQIQSATAKQLGIAKQDVLPLSAKQALLAKVRKDEELLARSQMAGLENLLCERIVAQKERLEEHLSEVRRNLTGSWTTLGINQAILHFFRAVEQDLHNLQHEADMANKMVAAIYRRHNEDNPLGGVDAPQFKIQRYLRELKKLQEKGDQFRLHLKTLLTEQRSLTRRFFATLAQEVIGLHQRLRLDAEQWAADALMPLMQHTLEHKQMLESHMLRLKALAQETQQTRKRSLQLARYREELEQQLALASDMLRVLRRPAPVQRQGKVVSLPSAARPRGAVDLG
ncbi:dynamin-like GTPase family protein [Pseudomonas chengduensis]|nr:dynamin-like GTPase family protein [Pseudomonas chengduensis]MDH1621425.1 dynamin-like GTPase family protein [Pseudomonas chengduensis]